MKPFDLHILASTIIGEAKNEPDKGKAAVAWVVMNRLSRQRKSWGRTIAAVCLMPKQFSCWNDAFRRRLLTIDERNPLFVKCEHIATGVVSGEIPDPTGDADHYYADYISPPDWAEKDKKTVVIGHHVFYKLT